MPVWDDHSDDTDLKPVLDWIDTMADNRDLSDEEREVASVIARRRLDSEDGDPLPKTVAREAVESAESEVCRAERDSTVGDPEVAQARSSTADK